MLDPDCLALARARTERALRVEREQDEAQPGVHPAGLVILDARDVAMLLEQLDTQRAALEHVRERWGDDVGFLDHWSKVAKALGMERKK